MKIEDIMRMAREADISIRGYYDETGSTPQELERFAKLVAAREREACAVICDLRKIITPEWRMDQHYNQATIHCANAIRARGRT